MFASVLVTIALLNFAAGSPAVNSPSEEETTRFSSLGLRFSTDDSIVHSYIDDSKVNVVGHEDAKTDCTTLCGYKVEECSFEDGKAMTCCKEGEKFISKEVGCRSDEEAGTECTNLCGEKVLKCNFEDGKDMTCCKEGEKFISKDVGCKNLCDNYYCENAGVCLLSNGAPKCFCLVPFHGDRCELVEEDHCRNSTLFCENGGKCVLVNGSQVPVCLCPSPFYGERCELGGKDKSDKYLYSLIWVLCSAIILSILVNCCLIVTRCRKNGGS